MEPGPHPTSRTRSPGFTSGRTKSAYWPALRVSIRDSNGVLTALASSLGHWGERGERHGGSLQGDSDVPRHVLLGSEDVVALLVPRGVLAVPATLEHRAIHLDPAPGLGVHLDDTGVRRASVHRTRPPDRSRRPQEESKKRLLAYVTGSGSK